MRQRGRKARCPYCQSNRTICKGFRRTQTLGDRKLRVCRNCRRKFTLGRPVAAAERQQAVAEAAM